MAHPDMDALLNEALDAAEQFLEKIGEFFPFVVTMAPGGEISHDQEHLGEQAPAAHETLAVLVGALKHAAAEGKYKATALVSHAHLPSPDGRFADAIGVSLEHRAEPPVNCFLPFACRDGKFEYGEIFAKRAERRVFPAKAEPTAHGRTAKRRRSHRSAE